MSSTNPKTFYIGLVAVHLIFFIYACCWGNITGHIDSKGYIYAAHNLIDYKTFYASNFNEHIRPEFYSLRTPAYPFFILLASFFTNNLYLVIFFQSVLSVVGFIILFKIFQKKEMVVNYSLLLLLSILFFANQLISCNMIMTEILFQFFLVIAFWFFIKYLKSENILHFLIMNLALAGGALTRPILIYFPVPVILFSLWFAYKKKKISIVACSFIVPIVVSLWCYRNYEQTGFYHYSYIKYRNLPDYNVSMLLANEYNKAYSDSVIKVIHKASDKMPLGERATYLEKESFRYINQFRLSYVILNIKGSLLQFIDPGRIEWFSFFKIENDPFSNSIWAQYKMDGFMGVLNAFKNFPVALLIVFLFIIVWNILLFAALVYYIFIWWGDYRIRLFLLALIGYLTLVTGPYGIARFKVAFYPLLVFILIDVANRLYKKKLSNTR